MPMKLPLDAAAVKPEASYMPRRNGPLWRQSSSSFRGAAGRFAAGARNDPVSSNSAHASVLITPSEK
jgi:hypothetical protein